MSIPVPVNPTPIIMKKIFFLLCVPACLLACNNSDKNKTGNDTGIIPGSDTSGSAKNGINDMDRDFARKVSMANMAEAEAGATAQRRGHSAAVKEYGKMMEDHHTAAQSELKGLASRYGLQVPDMPDSTQKLNSQKLNGMQGKTFDEAYIQMMVKDHREAISLFEIETNNGGHRDIKDFASRTLPILRMHLQKADSIATVLKIKIP